MLWFALNSHIRIPAPSGMMDALEYAVYQQWFDFVSASGEADLDLIGDIVVNDTQVL